MPDWQKSLDMGKTKKINSPGVYQRSGAIYFDLQFIMLRLPCSFLWARRCKLNSGRHEYC